MAAPNASRSVASLAGFLVVLADRERTLWVAVAVTYVLDVTLTAYGLSLGFQEANPVARATMVAVGPLPAMVALKTAVVGIAVVFTRVAPPAGRPLIPLAVAMPWGLASVSNFYLIFGA
ncbi:DUF5658 family protein [Halogeometricum limi]|uniref:DUF5658 domain-containing protein n=1 Tax=Halogeometricum limi TaxID=555875 RepID=A0A1I6GID7_9EURY|nr:DUF5658 family protein [Halogeometricum limi]SFR41944.1 hypothetical protein SAMN04488124_1089 [Halogeometricum limi]